MIWEPLYKTTFNSLTDSYINFYKKHSDKKCSFYVGTVEITGSSALAGMGKGE